MIANLLPVTPLVTVSDERLLEVDLEKRFLQLAIDDPCGEFCSRPGKRIRAEVVSLGYQAAGGVGEPPAELIDFIELLHAGSLVIDDIQDNSSCRRGRPALHVTHGTSMAINIGNWMYFSAIERLMEAKLDQSRVLMLIQRAVQVIKQCHEGQGLDLTIRISDLPQSLVPSVNERISRWKTGALTELAAWFGAMAAGASPGLCQQIGQFGNELGVGLQMQNDFVELQKAAFCQAQSEDLANQRVTWPWSWLASSLTSEQYQPLVEALPQGDVDQNGLAREMVLASEMIAVDQIGLQLEQSADLISPLLRLGESKNRLDQLVAMLELRYA